VEKQSTTVDKVKARHLKLVKVSIRNQPKNTTTKSIKPYVYL